MPDRFRELVAANYAVGRIMRAYLAYTAGEDADIIWDEISAALAGHRPESLLAAFIALASHAIGDTGADSEEWLHHWKSCTSPRTARTALTVADMRRTPLPAPSMASTRTRRSLARQRPRLLPREPRALHVGPAQLALLQDDQKSGHRPLARPRRTAHGRVDHEQQRCADPGDQ